MAGPGDADGKILSRGFAHERSQFVFRTRLRLVPGDEGLVANPVAPVAARPELRRRRLRDIGHISPPRPRGLPCAPAAPGRSRIGVERPARLTRFPKPDSAHVRSPRAGRARPPSFCAARALMPSSVAIMPAETSGRLMT